MMQAVINTQGKGLRLMPFTRDIPKSLVPVMGRPVIEYTLFLLEKYGIKDIIILLWNKSQMVKSFLERKRYNFNFIFIESHDIYYGLPVLKKYISGSFFYFSCDSFTNVNLLDMYSFHKRKKSLITFALIHRNNPGAGRYFVSSDGKIIKYVRRHTTPGYQYLGGTRIKIFSPDIFSFLSNSKLECSCLFDKEQPTFGYPTCCVVFFSNAPYLLFRKNSRCYGYISNAFSTEVGNFTSYLKLNFDLLDGKVKGYEDLLPYHISRKRKIYRGKGTKIHPSSQLIPPTFVGNRNIIAKHCRLGPFAILGDNMTVEANTIIEESVIWSDSNIPYGKHLRHCIVSQNYLQKISIGTI